MDRIGTNMALSWSYAESQFFPLSSEVVNEHFETIRKMAEVLVPNVPYADALDFLVGEVLGTEYQDNCKRFYDGDGKPLSAQRSSKELQSLDMRLATNLSAVLKAESDRSPCEVLTLLRRRCKVLQQYSK